MIDIKLNYYENKKYTTDSKLHQNFRRRHKNLPLQWELKVQLRFFY